VDRGIEELELVHPRSNPLEIRLKKLTGIKRKDESPDAKKDAQAEEINSLRYCAVAMQGGRQAGTSSPLRRRGCLMCRVGTVGWAPEGDPMNRTLHDDCADLDRALLQLAQQGDWTPHHTLSVVGCWLSRFFEDAPHGEAMLDRFVPR
jgi:hypothetical protein